MVSTLRLSRWFRRSYRGAICEKMRLTYARFVACSPPAAAARASAVSSSFTDIDERCPRHETRARQHGWIAVPSERSLWSSGAVHRPQARGGHRPMPAALDLLNLPDADVVALAQQGREAAVRELIRR